MSTSVMPSFFASCGDGGSRSSTRGFAPRASAVRCLAIFSRAPMGSNPLTQIHLHSGQLWHRGHKRLPHVVHQIGPPGLPFGVVRLVRTHQRVQRFSRAGSHLNSNGKPAVPAVRDSNLRLPFGCCLEYIDLCWPTWRLEL